MGKVIFRKKNGDTLPMSFNDKRMSKKQLRNMVNDNKDTLDEVESRPAIQQPIPYTKPKIKTKSEPKFISPFGIMINSDTLKEELVHMKNTIIPNGFNKSQLIQSIPEDEVYQFQKETGMVKITTYPHLQFYLVDVVSPINEKQINALYKQYKLNPRLQLKYKIHNGQYGDGITGEGFTSLILDLKKNGMIVKPST